MGQRINQFRRSIFGRYFIACASVIMVGFLGLAIALTVFSVRYSSRQRQALFYKHAVTIANLVLVTRNTIGAQVLMAQIVQGTQQVIDADSILIVATDGSVVVGPKTSKVVPSPVMEVLRNRGIYESVGTMEGFYDTQSIVEGVPIVDPSNNSVIGAVIVASRANMTGYFADIFRAFIICSGAALLFCFVAIYLITLRLVKPLREMSHAARSFAEGDFTKRVQVHTNDEVGQLAAAFNNMASSLASLEEMRSSFVANVSHELKTPMTSIAGFIDGILDGTVPEEKREYYLRIVSQEIKRLSRLVRSFLDIARIEAGELKINPTRFDIVEMARRVIVGFEYAIDEKELTVRGLEDPDAQQMVFADADLTHQIIHNLVDNAVKFANKGGYIQINIVPKDAKVYVGIKNSGMGIPKRDIPYIFDRFYKTDKSRSLDRKGVGLGLYIVKSILNRQGEDIAVKSVEGESCEFVFTLKRA